MFRYYFGLEKLWAKEDFFGVEMLAENGSGDGLQCLMRLPSHGPWSIKLGLWGKNAWKRCVQGRGGVYSA